MKRGAWVVPAALALALATAPLGADGKVYAIRGGTVHTLAGEPIENGVVLIEDGRITGVGKALSIPDGAEIVDAAGLDVYPGMFDAFSNLGLTEIRSVRATSDLGERGDFNPHLKASTAVHPAGEHIPVTRANGITHALVVPASARSAGRGGGATLLPGQASLINLDGWTWEEMEVDGRNAMTILWPTIRAGGGRGRRGGEPPPFKEAKEKYEEKVAELRTWFEAARHYKRAREAGAEAAPDSKLEALLPLLDGSQPALIVANRARTIRNAVAFAEEQKLRMILAGGQEAWKVAELLKQKNIPVILGPTEALPADRDDPYDKPFTAPEELRKAGVLFAFGSFSSDSSRTLPYQAGVAVAFGLPYEEALKAVTLYPARILGVEDKFGTIEEGKQANLILTDGDPLEITTRIRGLFIAGRPVSTGNKHLGLYEKYRSRPKPER